MVKPFVKWVGGKTQLLSTITQHLPKEFLDSDDKEKYTYIEPFVGGGAMLFHMLNTYPHKINKVVISDINKNLIDCYKVLKDKELFSFLLLELQNLDDKYNNLLIKMEDKESLYYEIRTLYNNSVNMSLPTKVAYFIFLNKTCFNGLYRENKEGIFNVPFGKHLHSNFFDKSNLVKVNELFNNKKVKFIFFWGDFSQTTLLIKRDENTLVYFDPPYRPLNKTSLFTSYNKKSFDDSEQKRLKLYLDHLTKEKNCKCILSNSQQEDDFFDVLYQNYNIHKIMARRNINSNGQKRGKIGEILVTNY